MSHPFRIDNPVRNCDRKYSDYHYYKPYLTKDFHGRCGYTDCPHRWFGGQRTFQIDHLKPWTKYPNLKTEYHNLVYCCSYVNRAKWDDDSPNYLDPCETDYNEHFERDDRGYIVPKTTQGKYMVDHMQLNLFRYAIIWNLERLCERIDKLKAVKTRTQEVKDLLLELLEKYYEYDNYLADNQ